MTQRHRLALFVALSMILAGCSGELGPQGDGSGGETGKGAGPANGGAAGVGGSGSASSGAGAGGGGVGADPFAGLPKGTAQWEHLCAQGYDDEVAQAFCQGASPPSLSSIVELEKLVGLEMVPGGNDNPAIAMVGHSVAVTARSVSGFNPRAFVHTRPLGSGAANPSYVVLAFSRGEMMVELAAKDKTTGEPRFYILVFEHACSQASGGCTNADLFTPIIESDWTDYTLYDDDTIRNTTMDCLRCHEPNGPGTGKMLRMQELNAYWMHWVFGEQGQLLSDLYTSFHGPNEGYAGIPPSDLYLDTSLPAPLGGSVAAEPRPLEELVRNNGFGNQPNAFDTPTIRAQLQNSGTSSTWEALYDKTVSGQQIPVPHYEEDVTDPAKVGPMRTAYLAFMAGDLPASQFPSLRDPFLESLLPGMSLRPKAGLSGRGIMQHICQQCHNSHLDQTISRAGFNVETLDQLPQATKDDAIARLSLPDDDPLKMPPPRFHLLSDAERQLVIDELTK